MKSLGSIVTRGIFVLPLPDLADPPASSLCGYIERGQLYLADVAIR
jgi:hypothetical protein